MHKKIALTLSLLMIIGCGGGGGGSSVNNAPAVSVAPTPTTPTANLSFDELKVKEVLQNRTFEKQVDADWSKARNMGVTGVPTFVAGGSGLVGAQPYEALVDLVDNVRSQN